MRVLIINFRQLVIGIVVLLVVLIAGVVLLVSDPLAVSDSYQREADSITTTAPIQEDALAGTKPQLALNVTTEGNTANVELLTQNFQFAPLHSNAEQKHGMGHAHVYVDGELKGQVDQAEFVLKELPKGEHELRVELAYSNHLPYKVEAVQQIEIK